MGFVVMRKPVAGKIPSPKEQSGEDREGDPYEKRFTGIQTMRK